MDASCPLLEQDLVDDPNGADAKDLLGLPLAVYSRETGDNPMKQEHPEERVRSSPGKPDDSPVMLLSKPGQRVSAGSLLTQRC